MNRNHSKKTHGRGKTGQRSSFQKKDVVLGDTQLALREALEKKMWKRQERAARIEQIRGSFQEMDGHVVKTVGALDGRRSAHKLMLDADEGAVRRGAKEMVGAVEETLGEMRLNDRPPGAVKEFITTAMDWAARTEAYLEEIRVAVEVLGGIAVKINGKEKELLETVVVDDGKEVARLEGVLEKKRKRLENLKKPESTIHVKPGKKLNRKIAKQGGIKLSQIMEIAQTEARKHDSRMETFFNTSSKLITEIEHLEAELTVAKASRLVVCEDERQRLEYLKTRGKVEANLTGMRDALSAAGLQLSKIKRFVAWLQDNAYPVKKGHVHPIDERKMAAVRDQPAKVLEALPRVESALDSIHAAVKVASEQLRMRLNIDVKQSGEAVACERKLADDIKASIVSDVQ